VEIGSTWAIAGIVVTLERVADYASWLLCPGYVNGILPLRRAGLRFSIQSVTAPAATAVTWPAIRAGCARNRRSSMDSLAHGHPGRLCS
jgi:hypothetical protein